VIEDRARGVMLYSLAALILLAGGGWFGWAAPDVEDGQMRARSARRFSTDVARGR
jgi:hypothetical protein